MTHLATDADPTTALAGRLRGPRRPTLLVGVPGWAGRALARMRRLFWLKALGMTLFMSIFFALYFHLLRHPLHPPVTMPLTALDTWLGYQPWAVWPYLSLWVYLGLAPMLMQQVRELSVYVLWNIVLCATGLLIFLFWPSAVPAFSHAAAPGWIHSVLRGVDAAGNACPSLHVATALFCGWRTHALLRELGVPGVLRLAQLAWLALIIFSTLAIKQHVWWDVLAGAVLAAAVAGAARYAGAARKRPAYSAG